MSLGGKDFNLVAANTPAKILTGGVVKNSMGDSYIGAKDPGQTTIRGDIELRGIEIR